ncbi:hypothetical protein KHM83_06620 [Fusibacter paucivorans]|uniref:PIN domain-containing protein n=1 Tax=Fusibacter paucivorans TaxID=76009 RepID=A0ABS5PMD6_9FIRM|nr:hypothetical protein [Fusibacter paucivorans]MBS7526345.1 hypothetical protein [Fusibacter paucivorans]
MNYLNYITGSIIIPSLIEYLISNKFKNLSDSLLKQSIQGKVAVFNENFADTEIDSQKLVEFLSFEDTKTKIFDVIFKAYKSKNLSREAFVLELADEATAYINKNRNGDYPNVTNINLMKDYFLALLRYIEELRETVLSINEKAIASLLTENINKSETNIINELNRTRDNDVLLNEKIKLYTESIEKGIFEESLDLIENTIYTVSMNNDQKIELLNLKAIIYVNMNMHKELEKTKEQINIINPTNGYIDRIEFWLAYLKHDDDGVDSILKTMKMKGVNTVAIMLYQSSYHLRNGNYEEVLKILLDEAGNMKNEFISEYKAFIQMGIIELSRENYQEALKSFLRAKELKNTIEAEYHCTMCEYKLFSASLEPVFYVNEKLIEKAGEIAEKMRAVEVFIHNAPKEVKLNYWVSYLMALGISNSYEALTEFERIDEEFRENKRVLSVIAEIHYQLMDYPTAADLYYKIRNEMPLNRARLLNCYSKMEKWDSVEHIFSDNNIIGYDHEGAILYHQIMLLDRKNDYTSINELISSLESIHYKPPIVVNLMIKTAHKYGDIAMQLAFIEILNRISDKLTIDEKLFFARTLANLREYKAMRDLLADEIYNNQDALKLYIASYEMVDSEDALFNELKDVVYGCYSLGIKLPLLIQKKFYIELLTERCEASLNTLKEYKELEGNDIFYQYNYIQAIIRGGLNDDAFLEAKKLLGSDVLSHRIMASQYYAYKGRWDEAKSQMVDSYFQLSDQISDKEEAAFVQISMNSFKGIYQEQKLDKANNDTVLTLASKMGKKVRICLHSSGSNVANNGEFKFDCYNYSGTSDEALELIALANTNEMVVYNGKEYKVLEIVETYIHLFRYFFSKLQDKRADTDNNFLFKITAGSAEETIEKMTEQLIESKKHTEKKLEEYNFGIETGMPLMYLSGKSPEKYKSIFHFLLGNDKYCLYSTTRTAEGKSKEYVLSLSSIFVLKNFELLDKLERLNNKIIITSGIKNFIKRGLNEAINSINIKGTTFLNDQNQLRVVEFTDEHKYANRKCWTDLLKCLNQFEELPMTSFNNEFYDVIYEIVDVSDFESIEVVRTKNVTLICDDWFIARANETYGRQNSTVGSLEFLYIEGGLSIEELYEVVSVASKKKLINAVSSEMLFDLYKDMIESEDSCKLEKLKDIFMDLFSGEYKDFQVRLYQELLHIIERNEMMTAAFYILIERPFGLVPYEQYLSDFIHNIRFEFVAENSNDNGLL